MSQPHPLYKRAGYRAMQVFSRLAAIVLFRVRVRGRELVPYEGGVLVCSNHQSHFDPVLIGLACDRRMNFLARKDLFDFAPFRWLIQFFDAIPIDRDGFSLDGIKETLRRLKRGEMVLMFPEGTRTSNGEMSPLKPGFTSMARRGKAAILPVGLAGSYEAWPRKSRWPRLSRIQIVIGEPLSVKEIAAMTDDQLLAELSARMESCYFQAKSAREL